MHLVTIYSGGVFSCLSHC